MASGAILFLVGAFVVLRTLRGHDAAGLIPTLRRVTGGDPYQPSTAAAGDASRPAGGAGQPAGGGLQTGDLAAVLTGARHVLNLHVPYAWGGTSTSGFDCSGLMQWLYARAGVKLPRTSYDQAKVGDPVSWGHFRPGDLIFASTDGPGASHVVMYVGHGMVIAAPHKGEDVKLEPVSWFRDTFVGARRVLVQGAGYGHREPGQLHGTGVPA